MEDNIYEGNITEITSFKFPIRKINVFENSPREIQIMYLVIHYCVKIHIKA